MTGHTQTTPTDGVTTTRRDRPDFPHHGECDGIDTKITEDSQRNGVVQYRHCRECGQIAELHITTGAVEYRRVNDDRLQYHESSLVDFKDSRGLPHVTGKLGRRAEFYEDEGDIDRARDLFLAKLHLEATWHRIKHPNGGGFFARLSPERTAEKIRDLP